MASAWWRARQAPIADDTAEEGHEMDRARFDAWTRRRVALVGGGFAAALVGAVPLAATEAKKKKKRKNGRPCNRCPLRRCCSCEEGEDAIACFLVAPDAPCPPCPGGGGGTTFEPVPGTANFCQTTNACARVACPVA